MYITTSFDGCLCTDRIWIGLESACFSLMTASEIFELIKAMREGYLMPDNVLPSFSLWVKVTVLLDLRFEGGGGGAVLFRVGLKVFGAGVLVEPLAACLDAAKA